MAPYYRLQQKVITNYNTFITNYNKMFYKLDQKFITNYDISNFPKLLMIITNCINSYYKVRLFSKLLQIRSKIIINYSIITNSVVKSIICKVTHLKIYDC